MKSTTKFKNHDDSPFIACICLHWKVDVNLHCFHFESSWQNVSRNLRVNFFAKFPDLVCVSSKMKYSRHDWSWDFDVFFSLSVLTKLTETLKTSQMEDRNRNQRQSLFPLPSSTCLPFSFLVLWSKINRRKGQSWQRKHSNLLFVSIDGFQGTRLPFASIFAYIPRDVDMMCILSFKSTKSSYMCVHPFKQRSIAITCTIIRLDTQRNRLFVEFFNRFVTRFDSSTTTQECNNLQQKKRQDRRHIACSRSLFLLLLHQTWKRGCTFSPNGDSGKNDVFEGNQKTGRLLSKYLFSWAASVVRANDSKVLKYDVPDAQTTSRREHKEIGQDECLYFICSWHSGYEKNTTRITIRGRIMPISCRVRYSHSDETLRVCLCIFITDNF